MAPAVGRGHPFRLPGGRLPDVVRNHVRKVLATGRMAGAGGSWDMDDKDTPRVGAAVRRRRRTLGLTLAAVAERSGLSVPFLSQIENERARPSARSMRSKSASVASRVPTDAAYFSAT